MKGLEGDLRSCGMTLWDGMLMEVGVKSCLGTGEEKFPSSAACGI